MLITPFKENDVNALVSMLNSRSMDTSLAYKTPRYGLIAYKDGAPIAAGFMRFIEGGYGMIDGYITHSGAHSADRNRALDLITYKMLKTSKASGIDKVLTFTNQETIITRAKKFGITQIPHTLLVIEF